MKLTLALQKMLDDHGIEYWHGYLVEQYTMHGKGGESFVLLSSFNTHTDLYGWLGY